MMSARECIGKAEECEAMAKVAADNVDRLMLLTAASHWRGLARAANGESIYGRPAASDDEA
jgi:hypothetical protein